jgi:heme exporter protein C
MFGFSNPQRFWRLSSVLLPWVWAAAVLLLLIGLYWSLVASPADYQQGTSVRIMYVHVPASWMSMACYGFLAAASFVSLIWRHVLADVAAKATAPIGATFTALALITGSLWGKPMWGTWWAWDARLTSVLVLFFLYLGYMGLWAAIDDRVKAARATAILALVGAVNLPIIKFSVDWWNTLHQGSSVIRADGPSLHASFLYPLLVMGLAYMFLFSGLLLVRMRTEILNRRIEAEQRRRAASETLAPASREGASHG